MLYRLSYKVKPLASDSRRLAVLSLYIYTITTVFSFKNSSKSDKNSNHGNLGQTMAYCALTERNIRKLLALYKFKYIGDAILHRKDNHKILNMLIKLITFYLKRDVLEFYLIPGHGVHLSKVISVSKAKSVAESFSLQN